MRTNNQTRMAHSNLNRTQSLLLFILLSAPGIASKGHAAPVVVERLHSFGFTNLTGALPLAGVIEGSDGALYGTTSEGGINDLGTVFKVNKDGTGYTVLKMFTPGDQVPGDGVKPSAGLLEGSDGALYGTTIKGGSDTALGSVFKIQKDGSGYTTLWRFRNTLQVGPQVPRYSTLVEGSDGALYGTSTGGGSAFWGMVYRVNKDGTGFGILRSFGLTADDGREPIGPLVEGADGALYGVTGSGGPPSDSSFRGTIYKLNKEGTGYTVVHNFGMVAGDGAMSLQGVSLGYYPTYYGLFRGSNGVLYGATPIGGFLDCCPLGIGHGTVFRLNGDGSGYATVKVFMNDPGEVNRPVAPLMEGSDGILYGVGGSGGTHGWGGVFKLNNDGNDYTVLQSFNLTGLGPRLPVFELIQGSDGRVYGTSAGGGSTNLGVIFRLNRDGTDQSVAWNFDRTGGDGYDALAALVEDSDGVLYGTTSGGGSANVGTIFKLSTNGTGYAILHSLSLPPEDGIHPESALLLASDGVLYGTTPNGGVNGYAGTIFKLNRDGSGYTILRDFGSDSPLNGVVPSGALIEASDGALYGVTASGGTPGGTGGTVFKLNKDGSDYTVLRSFNASTGNAPQGPLLEGSDGALYGTTYLGGTNGANQGTLFRMNKDGSGHVVLVSFQAPTALFRPNPGLVEGINGALYGTTRGVNNLGTMFRVNKDGSGYAVVHSFTGTAGDGALPVGGLVRGGGGTLYGTTAGGGTAFRGTVFRLNEDGSGYEVLWSFEPGDEIGTTPHAPLVRGRSGKFFGTTGGGIDRNFGGIFALHFTSLPPGVAALPTSFVSTSGALLYGSVTPNGADSTAWFEYGPTPAYGQATPPVAVGNGGKAVSVGGATVSNLEPGTEYHFRLTATNQVGVTFGTDMVFQTLLEVPQPRIRQFERLASGEFRLRFDGVIGASYVVEARCELLIDDPFLWQPLGTAVAVAPGQFEFTDNEAAQYATRFYRLTSP